MGIFKGFLRIFFFHPIENVNIIDGPRYKIVRNKVLDCHLSPNWRQMTIENTVSSDV